MLNDKQKALTVGDLITILQQYDAKIPLVFTRDGKGHQYGLYEEDISIIKSAYFGTDMRSDGLIGNKKEFLNLGYC